ncbi:patatin-like phospholipase family protein [Aquimonas voraii]|uniref:NTE family protein n=1 Tax=Aquimonas voraii TaxID=265719 RepID=A0A1G6WAD5_9GAMM|nr:patatin-like phospholipase family protein [Aquimonas voraii]SDD62673.1 NTE family protein [Aquimonas voraii]
MATEPGAIASAKRVSLVLGAGGARGLGHIGAIEVLQERGYRIVGIAGSSMGALVGGIHAAGRLPLYKEWACALERSDVLRLLDFSFGFPGLIRGDRVIGALRDLVGEHAIESLSIPFTAVATDLQSQREVWLNRGRLFDAIRASIAIPMVFTPYRLEGRDLVDGGLLAPVPIAATRQVRADLVIAIDVNGPPAAGFPRVEPAAEPLPVTTSEEPSGYRARIAAFIESLTAGFSDAKREAGAEQKAQPGLIDLMGRSLDTMQAQIARMQLALDPPDLLIRMPRDRCSFYEFWRAAELIELGRQCTQRALDAFEAGQRER